MPPPNVKFFQNVSQHGGGHVLINMWYIAKFRLQLAEQMISAQPKQFSAKVCRKTGGMVFRRWCCSR